ncbi:chromate transporter [Paenibacillus sp.]|jgi:chromate transporter|uniref:chromate transporter n=1 Tax=Paenibacillus sp. TaxID=58172 RepID=UPI0028329272|nr:chromate transporter [Paenibacillus sp.]MDR0268104.1 chromate transporter [Paenibacillus sp.]
MSHQPVKIKALLEVLAVSTKLGLTSFGGPIAHLGYFHNEYIRKRRWMDERSYADLVALCQLLPGPASSQVGIGIGVYRAGLLGGLIAWIGFTFPSVIALILFAFLLKGYDIGSQGWIHGLKIVAVAIVAQAVLGMGQKLTPDKGRVTIAIIVATIILLWQNPWSQVMLIAVSGFAGAWLYRKNDPMQAPDISVPVSRKLAAACLVAFSGLLFTLPLLSGYFAGGWLTFFDSFYRSGSLVFGGGHVVLPLLEQEVVSTGWVHKEDFLAGYGATQAVPGPLFTFAAYLGAMAKGIPGALIATVAIFSPAFLLVIGTLPFWSSLRQNRHIQGALTGINAAVVGILFAALYNPLWTTAIMSPGDYALVSILFVMLVFWKLPPWIIVLVGAAGGIIAGLT